MLIAWPGRACRRPSRRPGGRPLREGASPARPAMSLPKHIRKTTLALMALVLALLASASPAAATNYHDAIRDCFDDGQLEGHYTRHVLQQALSHLPADQVEYSDCNDVLRRAITASGTRGGGGSASPSIPGNPQLATPSGAQAASPQDLGNLNSQTSHPGANGPPRVDLSGSPITPAAAHFDSNKLPSSLLASLIALGVVSAIAGLLVIRRRWPETRRVALRLLRR